jgi:hypothetical protein
MLPSASLLPALESRMSRDEIEISSVVMVRDRHPF